MPDTARVKPPVADASVHLDAIRGLAALWVMMGHSRGYFMKTGLTQALAAHVRDTPGAMFPFNQSVWQSHWQFGLVLADRAIASRMAVIAFFVLSGYLVGGSVLRTVRKGTFSWKQYLFQRLTRLWVVLIPALLLGATLDLAGMRLLSSPTDIYRYGPFVAPVIAKNLTCSAFFGSMFFLQGILTRCFGNDAPLWSLSYEFWYYICFPLLVVALTGSKSNRIRIISGLLLLPLLVFCGWRISIYFFVWMLGAVVAMLPLKLPRSLEKSAMGAAAFLFLVTMFLELRFPIIGFLSDMTLGVAFSIFMWTVLHARGNTVHPLYRSSAQTLSRMSYTLYLVHAPMLIFISAVLMPVWGLWPFSAQSLFKLLLIDGAVLAASWMVYFCFERNTPRVRELIRQFGSKRLKPASQVTA